MDNGTPLIIEKLTRGAILGSYMFLVNDENKVTATCVTACQVYTLERTRFTELVMRDPGLLKTLLVVVDKLIESPSIDLTLDFVQMKEIIELPNGKFLEG